MKALIFAAGLGTRLGDITQSIPKALVEVGGEPMLKRVILKLKDAGIDYFVVNVHHHASMIIDYLKNNNNFGCHIHISDESAELLETGGGLLNARKYLDGSESFIMHNADVFTDFDIHAMIARHEESDNDVTLMVDNRMTSRYLLFDNNMRMRGWTDIRNGNLRTPWDGADGKTWQKLAFGGVHIANPLIFKYLSDYSETPKFSITPFYTDNCKILKILGYRPAEKYNWVDIGKPDSLIAAQNIASKL